MVVTPRDRQRRYINCSTLRAHSRAAPEKSPAWRRKNLPLVRTCEPATTPRNRRWKAARENVARLPCQNREHNETDGSRATARWCSPARLRANLSARHQTMPLTGRQIVPHLIGAASRPSSGAAAPLGFRPCSQSRKPPSPLLCRPPRRRVLIPCSSLLSQRKGKLAFGRADQATEPPPTVSPVAEGKMQPCGPNWPIPIADPQE